MKKFLGFIFYFFGMDPGELREGGRGYPEKHILIQLVEGENES